MSLWSRLWNKSYEEPRDTSRPMLELPVLERRVVADVPRQAAVFVDPEPRHQQYRAAMLGDGVHRRKRLDYPEAAAAFLEWLQAEDETGEITRPRLDALYAEHCEALGLAMVPVNFLFQALSRHAPKWERRVPRRDGRRQRVTTYDIPKQPATVPANYRSEAQLNRRAA